MSLEPGVLKVTFEYAKDLKDQDWFGKQDPYCIVKVGVQTYRTKTAKSGGKNPVWEETFAFNLLNENTLDVEVKDEDNIGRDDLIGIATISIARAREQGTDRQQVPVLSAKSRRQHGYISVNLQWTPNSKLTQ